MTDVANELTDHYRLTQLTDLAVSPDGDRIAYVTSEFDARANERRSSLFVVPADGSRAPHRLSRASTASSPQWSPDGEKLAFLAARDEDSALRADNDDPDEEEEDEEPTTQLWSFDLERGGDARQLTTFDEGAREFDWGPEGERVVVTARDPTEDQQEYLEQREDDGPIEVSRLQHKYDGKGWLDDVTSYLFVVDVDSRETTRIDEAYGAGAREPATGLAPAWSPDGDRIAFLSTRTERPDDAYYSDVYTIRPDGTGLEKLTDSSLAVGGGKWGPNGRYLAFPGSDAENQYDPTKLHIADTEAGGFQSVSSSLDRPLGRGGAFDWTDDETLLGLIGDEGQTRLVRFDATADDPERVYERQGAFEEVAQLSADGGTVALDVSGPHESSNVHSLAVEDVDGDVAPERLTDLNVDLLEEYDEPETRWVEFDSEGQTVEGLVYFPPGYDPDEGDAPLITTIHGGPISYDRPGFNYDYTFWTNRGYALLRVNYRGSSSYGGEFSRAIEGDWGHWEPADVIAGIEHVTDEGWVDEDRVFVTGFSYGGAQTAYILSQSDVATAGAAEHGIYDRYAYFGTGDSHNRMQRDFGLPWEDEDTYRSISSITDVGDIDAPLLVTAGENDWRCPPTQSEQLYVSVAKQGVDSKLVVYPDENHNVGDPDRAVHRLTELTEWFEKHDPDAE